MYDNEADDDEGGDDERSGDEDGGDEEGMKEVFRDIGSMCRINGNMTELAEIEQYLQHEYIGVFEKMH